MERIIFAVVALIIVQHASAETVFKCVDAQGRITFTARANCPVQSSLDDVVSAHNTRPSGSEAGTQMARPRTPRQTSRQTPKAYAATQSAGHATGDCSTGLSDSELRTAKVRGEITPGMSRNDVESMMGKPNNDGARGAGSSVYWNDRYLNYTAVSYDRNGCVRGSSRSGRRN